LTARVTLGDPTRVLRVSGLPAAMSISSLRRVLWNDRGVLGIDAHIVENDRFDTAVTIDIRVFEAGLERVRRKLLNGFVGITIDDVSESSPEPPSAKQR
jgi:hypothetical protein